MKKPSGEISKLTTVTGTVVAIDVQKRMVTIKGPKGNAFPFQVGEQVKNLPQVKVRDLVDITCTEALAVRVRPAKQ